MNLENFPTSKTAKKMLGMVSQGFYDDSYVGKWIYQVMGAELDGMDAKVEDLPYQAYVDTATWGLRYWEQLYGLETDESLSYEERRARIHIAEASGQPINPERIRRVLELLTNRPCEIVERNSEYKFKVIIYQGEDEIKWKKLMAWLDKAKPAHLSYDFVIDITDKINLYVGSLVMERKKLSEDESPYTPVDPGEALMAESGLDLITESGLSFLTE